MQPTNQFINASSEIIPQINKFNIDFDINSSDLRYFYKI